MVRIGSRKWTPAHIGTTIEAIAHSKVLAQHFRDDSLRDDQDLEISVVNASGREIHCEFVHREPDGK
jgi:hypothetical protein